MRISGGKARGIPLQVPKGDAVRPATDGMRQAVFSSLAARVEGGRFLDLFAGSGAYGLEALSRGAAGGIFVEKNSKAVACLRVNIASVCKSIGCRENLVRVEQGDALKVMNTSPESLPDLVFIDPPYEVIESVAPALFDRLNELLVEKTDPVIVFEMPGEISLEPKGWKSVRRLGKGVRQPTVVFFRKESAMASAGTA